jgi:hypothetical protein
MKKLIFFTILIVGICFAVVAFKFKSGNSQATSDRQNTQTTSNDSNSDQASSDTPKKLIVSEEELAKLKLQGVVSADEKYYIKAASPFPKIISLETGDGYTFRPNNSVTKISKLTWSGDGRALAYLYQVPDPDYLNTDILNTARILDVTNGDYPNANRVLAAGAKLDYAWLDDNRIVYYELQNFDTDKKFYRNANLNIYNIRSESFEYPLTTDVSLENVYNMTLSANNEKFLYVQAKLDDTGATTGQQYVVAKFDGTILSITDTFNPNWNK